MRKFCQPRLLYIYHASSSLFLKGRGPTKIVSAIGELLRETAGDEVTGLAVKQDAAKYGLLGKLLAFLMCWSPSCSDHM